MNDLITQVNTFLNSGVKVVKFRVVDTEFSSYSEVENWAWNEFKLESFGADTYEEQVEACEELTDMILNDKDLLEEYTWYKMYGPRRIQRSNV
jgi:TPP-dependent 2-oxoacid decarboxylase